MTDDRDRRINEIVSTYLDDPTKEGQLRAALQHLWKAAKRTHRAPARVLQVMPCPRPYMAVFYEDGKTTKREIECLALVTWDEDNKDDGPDFYLDGFVMADEGFHLAHSLRHFERIEG